MVTEKSEYTFAPGKRENPSVTPSVALYPRTGNKSVSIVASSADQRFIQFVPSASVTERADDIFRRVPPIFAITKSVADGSVPAYVLRARVRLFDVTEGSIRPFMRCPCGVNKF